MNKAKIPPVRMDVVTQFREEVRQRVVQATAAEGQMVVAFIATYPIADLPGALEALKEIGEKIRERGALEWAKAMIPGPTVVPIDM